MAREESPGTPPRDETLNTGFGQVASKPDSAPVADPGDTRYTPPSDAQAVEPVERPRLRQIGDYELITELGRGGMGVVYKARHVRLGRTVALKMIRSAGYASSTEIARFLAEARAEARLTHPNIVPIYDIGEADGLPYFAMEFVEGGSLQQQLADGPLPAKVAARLVQQVAEAIQHAHDRGVLHRDLKPQNILLQRDGDPSAGLSSAGPGQTAGKSGPGSTPRPATSLTPKVSDFGLARLSGEEGVTVSGDVLGTPSYMPPEQASGKTRAMGPRTDVYSLGAVLYCLLTGRPPFQAATTAETLRLVQEQEPLPPRRLNPGVHRDLDTICLKCLEKQPERRYVSAAELADELTRFLAGEPIRAVPTRPWTRVAKWVRRRPVVAGLLAAIVWLTAAGVGGIAWAYRQTAAAYTQAEAALVQARAEKRDRLRNQAEQLGTAAPAAVPQLLLSLNPDREDIRPYLEELYKGGARGRLRYAMALLPDRAELRDELAAAMSATGDPSEMLLLRNVLTPFAGDLKENLWRRAGDKRLNPDERFRSLVALASFDVGDPRWREFGGQAVEQLLRQPSVYLGDWSKALKPVAASLTIPLGDVFRGKVHPDKRQVAAEVLADYAADDPRLLADLLMDADQEQFAFIFPKFKEHGEQGLLLLTAEIDKMSPPDLPSSDANRETLAKRQANAAVALLRLNQPERVWPLLKHSRDPRVRSYLIHRLSPLGADAKAVAQRLQEEPDVTIRRALLLALGEFSDDEYPRQDREALIPMLQEIYRADHDAGLHAAAEWLLRQWKQDIWLTKTNAEWAKDGDFRAKKIAAIRAEVANDKTGTLPDWYVNTQGQTFVVIPGPVEFEMGSPETDAGHSRYQTRHKKRIGRTFALAAKSVTLADYEKFSAGYGDAVKRTVRTPDSPVVAVSWFMAVEYCNWLSKKEGLPESEWCYEPLEDSNALPALAASTVGLLVVPATGHGLFSAACSVHPGRTDGKYSPGMKLAADYLKRRGYRLPTEAEIEYATRAGASTSRFFGETDDLLNKYAWYLQNSQQRTWPVGTLKPNDFGLFDVQGNVATWCQERFMLYSKETTTLEDCEDVRVVSIQPARPSRGGSWVEVESKLRSAMRSSQDPTTRVLVQGFRLARTF